MADEPVVEAEITPEDFDGEQEKPKETPKADPTPAKEAKEEAKAEPKAEKPEAKEPEEEVKAKADTEPEVPDTETDKAEKPEETETDKPQKGLERRTDQLNSEIRDLVSQRNALKEQVAKANAEVYQPATEEELTEQGMAAHEAKLEAMRQRIEVKDYNDRVADAQLTLNSEAERVLRDYPIFNPESEQYDKELSEEAAAFVQNNLILDPNTSQVIGSNVDIGKYYETLARASGISTTKGQLKGQQDTEQMLANADTGSSAAPPKKVVDPLDALWAEPL